MTGRQMRAAVWLPPFDELSDPIVLARLAADAEEAGWDGFFLWDHVRWNEPVRSVADPWIALAAAATATERLLLGPMVTPLARRRPVKVARETATLDRLSNGRLVLGVGLGSDRFGGEFSRTGEELGDRARAGMLDESLSVLQAAWSGNAVHHLGSHYRVDDITFLPTPTDARIPVWVAAFPGNRRPLRRAARHNGFFPVHLDSADQLAEAVATIDEFRGGPDSSYEVAVALEAGADPARYAAAGATWWLTELDPYDLRLDRIRALIRAGPDTAVSST